MEIGIIGGGDMGKLCARELASAGFRVNICDRPENEQKLRLELSDSRINVLENGIQISKKCDFIYYLVEVENMDNAVSACARFTKRGAVVCAGTSVMTPSVDIFKKYLPSDVGMATWHWLHGPSVKPQGQISVADILNVNASYKTEKTIIALAEAVGSKLVIMDYKEHDKITADTQVNLHLGLEAMGTAWRKVGSFPWDNPVYSGGIDNVKILVCLSMHAGKPHVYSGLAFANPFSLEHVTQYSNSVTDIFTLMIKGDKPKLEKRLRAAGESIFWKNRAPPMLEEKVIEGFGLGKNTGEAKPNTHLSIFGYVDSCNILGVDPYHNAVCRTPMSRLRLGMAQYLFENEDLFKESIDTMVSDMSVRGDDLQFTKAVDRWATIIRSGSKETYTEEFNANKAFFGNALLGEAVAKRNQLLGMMRVEEKMPQVTRIKNAA